jgi:hypothetical protein
LELIVFKFENFQLLYFCMSDEVVFWKNKEAA